MSMGYIMPSIEGTHFTVRSPAAPSNKPVFRYTNVSGQFTLQADYGEAIYRWLDGNFYSDKLAYTGLIRVGQPDDDINCIGFDSGWAYKVQNENWWFLFSEVPFTPASHPGQTLYRIYTSVDGRTFQRWKTASGTSRISIPLVQQSNPNGQGQGGSTNLGTTNVSSGELEQVRAALERLLAPLAQGNEGKVSVSVSLTSPTSIHFDVQVRHRHKITSFLPPAYDLTMSASGELDVLNPASAGNINVCVDLPPGMGRACITLVEIVELLTRL